jgi:Na+-transporting NADH:ubiquinone oxidoreductase subunit NqrB
MSASAPVSSGGRSVAIRGRSYPVLLPKPRDPRLHLAAVIVSLQVLGQVAFGFDLSIAQILISLATCAILEVAIAFRSQRVIMWPASALLTGNGVAFILRVPGTEHGDWWSLRGWWIFAGTAAVSLLSKHIIRIGKAHIFNPSNIGLVLCFLILPARLAEPLDFWWSPMDTWMVLALVIIVTGGLAILARLRLLAIAVGFWLSFAAGIGVLALSGHAMTARWHLGPIEGWDFWWLLVTSPEILVFLFFMITDPKTIPAGGRARIVYAVSIGLLATLLIAPQTTEYATKVAVLSSLAIVCLARPLLARLPLRVPLPSGRRLAGVATLGAAALMAAIVAAGAPARPDAETAAAPAAVEAGALPAITLLPSDDVDARLDDRAVREIAGRVLERLGGGYRVDRMVVSLRRGEGQGPPVVVVRCAGTRQLASSSSPPSFERTFELSEEHGRFVFKGASESPARPQQVTPEVRRAAAAAFASVRLTDVAQRVGLDFRHGAFRYGMDDDTPAMMGGGLCWLDVEGDGWLDLFVVNSYADEDLPKWLEHGGLPRSALFRNRGGTFDDVTEESGAGLEIRGNGCVAADLNGDGHTDLYVTSAVSDVLLWNDGDGTFTEGARAAGVVSFGWRSGAAVADVDGDDRPDLFVAGYTDVNAPVPGSAAGFPTNHAAVRDLLFLNLGNGPDGRARFREVGVQAGLEQTARDHGLGAVFSDFDGDGRLDLYVANDADPNRLYLNVHAPGPLGFRFEERAHGAGVADRNAGMGIATADWSADGRPDLVVSNARGQQHAAFRSAGRSFADARRAFTAALGTDATGWGVSWVDLELDGNLDLVMADGAIPVKGLAKDARTVRVIGNLAQRLPGRFTDVSSLVGTASGPKVNGRGVAAADFDNDGRVDVAVNSVGGRLMLLRNTGPKAHWLEVGLDRFAPGTTITAILPDGRRLLREVQAGSSYLSSEDPRVHFGLGEATSVHELIVRYPDGATARRKGIAVDRIIRLEAG